MGLIWQTPPEVASTFNGTSFALTGNIDDMLTKIAATNSTYTESALSFMLPVNPATCPSCGTVARR